MGRRRGLGGRLLLLLLLLCLGPPLLLLLLLRSRREDAVLMHGSSCHHFHAEGTEEDFPSAVPVRLQQGEVGGGGGSDF